MKIVSVVGARPQFVKLAPLSKKIRARFQELIVHTGQHYESVMSDVIFRDLQIANPRYNLGIGSGLHGNQTGRMLAELEKVFLDEAPSLVIVFGDTNSTLAASLAAVKLQIPVVHIEAGLRSSNRTMPEEINRIATDHISDYLFAPTVTAMEHLRTEGLAERSWLTGDIMKEALEESLPFALEKSTILEAMGLTGKSYYLLTLHRPYNVDRPDILSRIFETLRKLGKKIVFSVHPRTEKVIREHLIVLGGDIITTGPQSYYDFLRLEYSAEKILTDSGGIQKEAYLLRKPCITFRPETEWIETVRDGWNILLDPLGKDAHQTILDFMPGKEQSDPFGCNVSDAMLSAIEKIASR